ncbi:major facilitator superfamily domain-containing protein 6-like [Branchiostoma floridae]|uniref:Major facilitator superfamily domain-containing protein 6-like n=1 Tax=Branchiostoma floridae TaxID=7739 RepID=A0A9J7KYE1_BRAFL|nr:major facilitator superfamily domain-containing protein 6-like [Branchiostoma floridae]
MWAAVTSYASSSAQDNLQTVAQAIMATTFFGIGDPLGNLVGGLIFDQYGAVVSFRCLAVSCLIGFLLFYLLHRCFGKKENPSERQRGTGEENETKTPFAPARDEDESAALKPGAFLKGGSVTNRAGEHIGFLRIVRPQNTAW